MAVDAASDDSYFKFNLDYINLYNLIRLESSDEKSIYQAAYAQLRSYTGSDQNAFFNVIDLALNGPNAARDGQTLALLDGWLLRLRRDFAVDLTQAVPVCGAQACTPVPVWLRPNTDFLWQRSPYTLTNTGAGIIETAGIDYILPYWMARYYGLQESTVVTSSAAPVGVVGARVDCVNVRHQSGSGDGAGFDAAAAVVARRRERHGAGCGGELRHAAMLYVSPGQINFAMPPQLATGVATFTVVNGTDTPVTAIGAVGQVGPTLFSMNGTGASTGRGDGCEHQRRSIDSRESAELQQFAVSACTDKCSRQCSGVSDPLRDGDQEPQRAR